MNITFDDSCTNLIAEYTIDASGNGTAVYLCDGHEITAGEYDAIQSAALDRCLNAA